MEVREQFGRPGIQLLHIGLLRSRDRAETEKVESKGLDTGLETNTMRDDDAQHFTSSSKGKKRWASSSS